jgi:hypothetical protein
MKLADTFHPSTLSAHSRWWLSHTFAIILLALFAAWLVRHYQPPGHDWQATLRPAIVDYVFHGQSPFLQPAFHSPPWVLLPLIPFALLPVGVDNVVLFLLALVVFGLCAWRLGARPLPLALFVLSPPTINVAYNGQIDWYVPLGLFLPRPLGLFFVLAKPQIGLGIAVYWLFDSYRQGGLRHVARDFAPVTLAFALSFVVFGPYLLQTGELLAPGIWWNITFWPYGIPIGLGLLVGAIRRKTVRPAIASGAFLSPYVAIYSWSVPLLALADDWVVMSVVCASLYWLVQFVHP